MMEKNLYLTISLLCLLLMAGVAASSTPGLQVLSSSDSEFHFKLEFALTASAAADSASSEQFDQSRSFLLALPVGGNARVVTARGYNPVESHQADLDNPRRDLVEVSRPFVVRGRHLVNITVNGQVNGTVFGSIEARIAIDGAGEQRAASVPNESGSFSRIFASTIANYTVARSWVETGTRSTAMATAASDDLYAANQWYKVVVGQSGLYRITGSQLAAAGISLSGLVSDSIRLFNAGGLPLPELNEVPRPTFEEISILIEDGGDGQFNSQDYLLFFGEGVNRWVYAPSTEPTYELNPYTGNNVYWLAVSGDFSASAQRMTPTLSQSYDVYDTLVDRYQKYVYAGQENVLSTAPDGHRVDYYNWFWSDSTAVTFFMPTMGVVPSSTARLTLTGNTNSGTGGSSYMDVTVGGIPGFNKDCNSRVCEFETAGLSDGMTEIRVTLGPLASDVPPYFDNARLEYNCRVRPENNVLDFSIGQASGRARVEIQDLFSGTPLLLNIDDPRHPKNVVSFDEIGGGILFGYNLASAGPNRFFGTLAAQALSPLSIALSAPENLREIPEQTDLIIVTSQALAPYLDDYKSYRESAGHSIRVVTVADIMDNFSYGLYDPTAIRDFLKFAYENYPTPAPSAVLFVGDGSYDFRGNTGSSFHSHVPPYIRGVDSAYSDDAYVHFGAVGILDSDTSYIGTPDRGLDMMTARWPVRSAAEIQAIVQKIKNYETAGQFGIWRNRIILVADDQYTDDTETELFHGTQTEQLDRDHIPAIFERKKIYLWEYPRINRAKPAVNDAIVAAINEGALITNYVGHGNPDVWAHEHVFERSADLPRLTNSNMPTLIFAASCAISFFDDPLREGMGEDLLSMSSGGAIGVVAATRLVYSSSNAAFNRMAFDALLLTDSLAICEAVYVAKLNRQYPGPSRNVNDQKYIYFGGPFVALARPRYGLVFDNPPTSLTALERKHVSGHVVNEAQEKVTMDGTLDIRIHDSDRGKLFQLIIGGSVVGQVPYNVTGPTIFRGSATVTGGDFSFGFVVPLDVGFGGTGASVIAYGEMEGVDAIGQIDSLAIADSALAITDSIGPEISYEFAGRSGFVSGDLVTTDDILIIGLVDSSGINLTENMGHGLSLEIDDLADSRIDLTSLFAYDQDQLAAGSLRFPLTGLPQGPHQLKIRAWDNANNLSVASLAVEVSASNQLRLVELLNYPNPMHDSTAFYFSLTQPVESFSLEIFTLSGRKIKVLKEYNLPQGTYPNGSHSIVWDGRDADGDRVATGVYIYKASAQAESRDEQIEMFGKVVVVN